MKSHSQTASPEGATQPRMKPTTGAWHLSLVVCIAASVLGSVMTRIRGAAGQLTPLC
jgi:hypothetical protein